ncbi:histidine kinase-like ATPase [Cladochytrium replicatum]|nr:histidine kinase-like ATPase [Cladochytrium replicatum]
MSAAGRIQRLDGSTTHTIASAQVILSLANIVKELVENSLDAGATSIEVRFRDYGLNGVERFLSDNGSGIRKEDYVNLALKSYTSKIRDFQDVETVSSFGFRGEALSSICAIGSLVVTTASREDAPSGNRLEYYSNGVLRTCTSVAREQGKFTLMIMALRSMTFRTGTTITVNNLFESLPVRCREFKRNISKEYSACLDAMYEYAIICEITKFLTQSSKRKLVIGTSGNSSIRDNISQLFSSKAASGVISFHKTLTPHEAGFTERPQKGYTRNTPDQQYIFINQRPSDMPKVSKLVNEVFRQYNSLHYPFLVINFTLPNGVFDVNVTPDKRTIFLHNENNILEALKVRKITSSEIYDLILYRICFQTYFKTVPCQMNHMDLRLVFIISWTEDLCRNNQVPI